MKYLEQWRRRVSLVVQMDPPPDQPLLARGQVVMTVQGAKSSPVALPSGYWVFTDLAPGPRILSWRAEHYQDGQQSIDIAALAPLAPMVRVTATAPAPVAITLTALTRGYVGKAYRKAVTTSGGKPPLTFDAVGLPPGIAIDVQTGVIAGTTYVRGRFQVEVSVRDHNGNRHARTYSFSIVT